MPKKSLNKAQYQQAVYKLRSNPLFGSLKDRDFTSLLDHVVLAGLKEGEALFKQNDVADALYFLQAGQIKLIRLSTAGNEKIIEMIFPGQTFAEAVIFSDLGRYPVSAISTSESQVWCIDSEQYKKVLRTSYDTCFTVMAALSRRLHQQVSEIDYLTLHNATARLASFLVNESGISNDVVLEEVVPIVELPYAKVVLASLLSIKPETLSRTFSKLSREGIIRIEDRRIVLLDIERLKQLQLEG